MTERHPVGVLKDELGNPVGLREFPAGDTLPKSILPILDAGDVGADPAGTAQELVGGLALDVDVALAGKVDDDDPRLTDARAPTGGAGGVLSGQYPNPGFAVDMATQAELDAVADAKVDKAAGMGLSSNDFTDPLREKLIGLEGTHWRGTFVSLAALQAGVTDPEAGDYADVDAVGDDVVRYIWDATDGIWVAQSGAVAPITASQVKLLYESNPDTNAFTDADEAKLGGIEAGATANSTDAHLLNRANHTGTQAISTVAGLQGELDAIDGLIGDIGSALDAINGEAV